LYLSNPANAGSSAALVEAMLKASAVTTGTISKDGRPIKVIYAGGY
jgi:hypothetical protein